MALAARLREAEAQHAAADAEVAALHDQAAQRAAESDRCAQQVEVQSGMQCALSSLHDQGDMCSILQTRLCQGLRHVDRHMHSASNTVPARGLFKVKASPEECA